MDVSLPGADTLPDYARTWNVFGGKVNPSTHGDYGKFGPWRAPGRVS
eukprot:gene9911-21337_t